VKIREKPLNALNSEADASHGRARRNTKTLNSLNSLNPLTPKTEEKPLLGCEPFKELGLTQRIDRNLVYAL
jgi:hypothetical protein